MDLNDPVILQKLGNFRHSIDQMDCILQTALSEDAMKDLSLTDQLNHDLFIAYMLNTLYWCYLRSKGLDPNANKVKEEISRVRQYMIRAKQAIDRHTVRKTTKNPVVVRIIKHALGKMDSGKRKHDEHQEDKGEPTKKQMKVEQL